MAILTELPFAAARELLDAFDLTLIKLTPLAAGSVNSNFFVQARDPDGNLRELFARIYEEQGEEGARFELELNLALAANHIPVALPIRRRDGSLYGLFESKPFALYERVQGEVSCQRSVSPSRCFAVGRALGRVHCADLGDLRLHPSRFGFEQIRARLDQVAEAGRPSLLASVERLRSDCSTLEEERSTQLPQGLIHGDLFRDNVLLSGDDVSALLDFESASLGTFVYDLMVTILAWCFGSELDEELVLALLSGYTSVRRLSALERSEMVTEGRVACVRFAATRLTDFSLRVPEGKRPGRDFRRFLQRQDALRSGVLERVLSRLEPSES